MKKIYIFTAVLALLTLSLNAQNSTKDHLVKQTSTTEKQVDMPQLGFKKALNLGVKHAPNHAPQRANRGTMTWSWVGANNGTTLPTGWTMTDPDHSALNDNGDGTWYIGVSDDGSATAQSITIPASVFAGCDNVTVVIRAKIDTGASGKSISVNGSSKSLTNTLTDYTWENISTTNGVLIEPTDGYVGFASIIITGEIDSNDETICDGTDTNGYLPIYGLYHDEYQINQMIYPENLLTNLVGKTLTSMTFYATSALSTKLSGSLWTIKLGTTSQTTFASSLSSVTRLVPDDIKSVITGYALPTGESEMTIVFTTPFTYNGGNLLVDFQSTQKPSSSSNYNSTNFYGVNQSTYTGFNSNSSSASPGSNGHYSSTGSGVRQFLPKVTFTYEKEDQHDLSIALSAPATAGAGSTVDVTATVTNNGDFAENGYTVTVSDGTNNVNITAQEELGIGETTTFTVQFATSANAAGSTVNYTATVACTDDAVTGNNSATASTSILNCPPPENVAATVDGNNATMTWDAPTISSTQESYSWDFESQSQFNDWTLVSLDTDSYNWQYTTYVEGTSADVFEPHSGTGYIVSPSFVNNVGALNPDNWLISPEVTLGGTFTFWAKGTADGYYAENFGVFVYEGSYSGGTTGFVQVDVDKTSTFGWVKYTFDLTDYSGKGRIAIRHYNCTDMYWLEVDDIEYNVTVSDPQPVSYNIYLDGELVGNVNANTFSYDFSNVSYGDHQCAVSAVYSYGESAAVPANFTIQHPAELTAPANGSTVDVGTNTGSGTSTTVTVSGSYLTQDLSVSVSGDGFTVSPTTISAADANAGTTITVSYNGTDPNATGTLTISSGEVTTTVSLSATYSESEPAFSTNGIIRMGNLIIVDQFWASTAENTHPEQYSYILRYTPAQGDPKESSPKTVDVEHVKSVVNGYYTEEDVKNDSITYNTVIVNKMTADVEMTLPNNDNKIYYVRLQGRDNDVPSEADKVNDNSDMIVKLQMTSGDGGFYYIDQIPTSHPQYTPGQVNHFMDPAEPGTGSSYGDFKSYVPSVMTYGQSRRYFANDTLHNTYGAPVWRTGIGDVTIQNGMKVERQSNQWGTTQWEANGQACSLYILDNILAYGKLPNKQNSNVDYEPYMFRVFVESPSGKLRGYTPQNVYSPEKPDSIIGTELVADNSFTNFTGPICIYSEYFDGASHIDTVADATNGDYFQFTLNKNSDNWMDNAMFGGLDDIIQGEGDDLSLSDNDLKVYVRFYYRSKGSINPSHVIRGRDASLPHMYYGAEAESPTPDPWTSVTEVRSHGEIIGVTYVNAQGMTSNKPFDGLNIVVTRYSDGSTTTTKVVR